MPDSAVLLAYKDGIDAAYRVGDYEGFKTVPACPYPTQSDTWSAWWDGFGDGTDDLINYQRSEL